MLIGDRKFYQLTTGGYRAEKRESAGGGGCVSGISFDEI
jgi:hypothetical protein